MISSLLWDSVWMQLNNGNPPYIIRSITDHSKKSATAHLIHESNYRKYRPECSHFPGYQVVFEKVSIQLDQTSKLLHNYASYQFFSCDAIKTWIGITGTNGKTSTLYALEQLLSEHYPVASIGTLGVRIKGANSTSTYSPNTTLPLFELVEASKEIHESGCRIVIMEASSIGYVEGRLLGVPFQCMIAHEVTQDHLDYHVSFAEYLECKKAISKLAKNCITTRKGFMQGLGSDNTVVVSTDSEDYYALNTSCAIACCEVLHLLYSSITPKKPPGRYEKIETAHKTVIIDYAHSPAALEHLLKANLSMPITLVFGCGGDRDRDKRKRMGEIAEKYANRCILTMDNPRWEDCLQPLKDTAIGAPHARIIPDRRMAIWYALSTAQIGDCIIVAGKGDESFIEFCGELIPFSDRQVILEWANQSQKTIR